ncbi:MAG: ChaN family lipoprotein, partial [Bacteroidia bacterium]|nr:ChaN family lipoprotein [Bacteroidia bacterium]
MKYLFWFGCWVIQVAFAQLPAYQIYNSKGKAVTFQTVLAEMGKADVFFFGELHNNPIAHWLTYELVYQHGQKTFHQFVIGMEMLETHQQEVLNAYLQGKIDTDTWESEKLWQNYKTDYKPIIEYAKQNRVPVIATNIPRQYARIVNRFGLDSLVALPDSEKKFFMKLPIEIPQTQSYENMKTMFHDGKNPEQQNRFVAAQAVKDATMAERILQHHKKGQLFFHLNGSYHSDDREGILWYLKKANPNLKLLTLTTVESETMKKPQPAILQKADFI